MKKSIFGFVMIFLSIIFFSNVANCQEYVYDSDKIKVDIVRSIRILFLSDIDKGFQSIRGKEISKNEDGTIFYHVASDRIETHADFHCIYLQPGDPIGYYFATYGDDPDLLNKSLNAFLEMGNPWPKGGPINPCTVKKIDALSIDGKIIYGMYAQGLKIGQYLLDEKEKTGAMVIGAL